MRMTKLEAAPEISLTGRSSHDWGLEDNLTICLSATSYDSLYKIEWSKICSSRTERSKRIRVIGKFRFRSGLVAQQRLQHLFKSSLKFTEFG